MSNRINLGIIVSKEELDSIKLIQNKLATSAQMLTTTPYNVDDEMLDRYVRSVVKIRGEITWLEQDWWDEILKKYKLTGNVFIDFQDGSLYLVEENK